MSDFREGFRDGFGGVMRSTWDIWFAFVRFLRAVKQTARAQRTLLAQRGPASVPRLVLFQLADAVLTWHFVAVVAIGVALAWWWA